MTSYFQILLVEDNPGDTDLIDEMLSQVSASGYEIKIAGTLADARIALKTRAFDAVLLDLG